MRIAPRLLAFFLLAGAPLAAAEEIGSTAPVYRTPEGPLAAIIDAPATPEALLDPGRRWLLLLERSALPPIAELAERELRLGGLRISPRLDGPSRSRPFTGLEQVRLTEVRLTDLETRRFHGLPPEAKIGNPVFSPDGSRLAFTHTTEDGIELWAAEVERAAAHRLSPARLSLAMRAGPRWLAGGQALVVALVPAGRGSEPAAPRVPAGPTIQENLGRTAPARTYQDLLQTPHDETLFEHYFTVQLARVGLDGQIHLLGEPAIVESFEPSPDGRFLLVEILERPFSYRVPAERFPKRIEVWDADGHLVHRLARLPLRDEVPVSFGSVPVGPRQMEWRDDAPATLVWAEALDGGDAGVEAAERDRVFQLAAPFTGQPTVLATLGLRYAGVMWGDDQLAMVSEWWWKTRQARVWRVWPGEPAKPPKLLIERSFEDRYADPGRPLTRGDARGRQVLLTAPGSDRLFLAGEGASPEGDRPFLDRYDPATGKTERLFRSEAPFYEQPIQLLDDTGRLLLVRRESREEPPNFFLRDLQTGELRQVTAFPHPTPQLRGVQKELVRYRRADGVDLTATLYLPPGYAAEKDGPLPLLLWVYPREFKSAEAAGQVTDSPYRFDRVAWYSAVMWVARGYAVLDDPSMPIVGEGEAEPNDRYVAQLVASAEAAIDEAVKRGVAERGRVAIGGHSYGAFTTANLLAHSGLFAAGIAMSGAYNRTLTPFGFQSEERTLWQAPETYVGMSPFLFADRIDEPLLLIHGEADNNPGTFPMQSERFFSALQGLGATARLVMLPEESHGYRARESVLHMLWEVDHWLETWVKNAHPETPKVEGVVVE